MTGHSISLALFIFPCVAILAWHMVKPNVRDLRLSMARFMPDMPRSASARMRISLVPPMGSVVFWLRMILLALLGFALWSHLLPDIEGLAEEPEREILRIVLDQSPSMLLDDRPSQARAAITTLAVAFEVAHAGCIETVAVDAGGVRLLPAQMPDTAPPTGSARVAQGMPSSSVTAALSVRVPGGCGARPTMAAVVSDLPPQAVPAAVFTGQVAWWQVGAPLSNTALTGMRPMGGGLSGQAATIELRAQVYGPPADTPTVAWQSAGQSGVIRLVPDPQLAGGFRGEIPYGGPGRYRASLQRGDVWDGDDAIEIDVPTMDRLAVDWRLTAIHRPLILAQLGEEAVLVAAAETVQDADLARRHVLVAQSFGASVPRGRLGVFVHRHPLLEGLNLDALEWVDPTGVTSLPPGYTPVLRLDAPGAPVLIAVREDPRGALVSWIDAGALGDPDRRAAARDVSAVMLGNALRWVSDPVGALGLEAGHFDAAGNRVVNALLESNTALPVADQPDLTLLAAPSQPRENAPAPPEPQPWTPWILALALAVLCFERVSGAIWKDAA